MSHDLTKLAEEHLGIAHEARSGRSAHTLSGSQTQHLSQTLIALADGHQPQEHANPGEATLQVLTVPSP